MIVRAKASIDLVRVDDGRDGIPGKPGADGRTPYLHIAYANSADGKVGFSVVDGVNKSYIGQYTDFVSADSGDPSKYKWTKIKGADGANGVGISSIEDQYYQSSSNTQLIGGSWLSTYPAWVDGKYLWTRYYITYTNGMTEQTAPVCMTGPQGNTGANGVGVSDVDALYAQSTSNTTAPTSGWSIVPPAWVDGKYVWSKTVIKYTNGTSVETPPVCLTGSKGENGKPGSNGVGIKSTAISYQAGAFQTVAPTGTWTANPPKLSAALPYLWTKTVITYTDGKTSTSYSVSSTLDGVEVGGKNYVRNKKGTKSDTINGITVEYLDNEFHVYGTNTKTEGAYGVGTWITYDGIFAKGETWTLSVDKPLPDGAYVSLNSWASDGSYQIGLGSINSDWSKPSESVTFIIPENCNLNATGFFGIYGRVKEIDITIRIKLEKGNKATDWTPAPEDIKEDLDNAQTDADNANDKIDQQIPNIEQANSQIEILNKSISSLVTDQNGGSLMTQTSDGWTFNISSIQNGIDSALEGVNEVKGDISGVKDLADKTNQLANDIAKKTAYINMTQDENGQPVLELGQQNGEFRLRITNTSMDFMQGSQKIAYLSNRQLYIQSSVVTDEMKIGAGEGYVWKKRTNGNMGLRYIKS